MVLTPLRSFPAASAVALSAMAGGSPATAQELDRAAPLLEAPAEYAATPIQIGSGRLHLGLDLRGEYIDNIYALPSNEIDDFRLTVSPRFNLAFDNQRFRLALRGSAAARRYADNRTENSTSALLATDGIWRLSQADTLSLTAAANRAVEDRGEPESRRSPAASPRRYNILTGDLGYRRQAGRTLFSIRGTALRNNAVSRSDRERDFTQWSVQGRAGVRISGTSLLFGDAYITHRNFDLRTDRSGIDRDSRTVGGRAGITIDPGGLLRGEASVGLFRFNPSDPSLKSRTGVSAAAGLIYQPRERLAFTLDAFRGDVATVRTGAQARTDTRFRLGVQAEAYHNLRMQAGLVYRRTKYLGSGDRERTVGAIGEVEYLVNRRFAVALQGRTAKRTSTDPGDEFGRNSIGLELRFQY